MRTCACRTTRRRRTQKKRLQEKMDRAIKLGKKGAVGSVVVRSLLGTAGLTEEQIEANKRLDREFMEQILALLPLCYIFKNPAFQEEKEWRSVNIVFSPVFSSVFDSKDYSEWHLEHMDFRALPDRIVPYKEFSLDTKLDRPAIREVVLGPRNVTPVQVVEAALKRHGWKGVDVRKSTASYR